MYIPDDPRLNPPEVEDPKVAFVCEDCGKPIYEFSEYAECYGDRLCPDCAEGCDEAKWQYAEKVVDHVDW